MTQEQEAERRTSTHEGGCHCGYIKFTATISPPLSELKVLDCSCSMCRKAGYLLAYPNREDIKWHGDSLSRCAIYRFNTKEKDQLFCPKCGTSIAIDFRDFYKPKFDGYGLSVRTLYGVDIDTLNYEKNPGHENVKPARDLSGIQWELDEKERAEKEAETTSST